MRNTQTAAPPPIGPFTDAGGSSGLTDVPTFAMRTPPGYTPRTVTPVKQPIPDNKGAANYLASVLPRAFRFA